MTPLPSGRERSHGSTALDPHGTDHALGNAADVDNGAGSASDTNFAFRVDYLPFIWELMDSNPAYGLNGLRPMGISQLHHRQRRTLSALLENHGPELLAIIRAWRRSDQDAEVAEVTPAERRLRRRHQQEYQVLLSRTRDFSRELYRRFRDIRTEFPRRLGEHSPDLHSLRVVEDYLRELEAGRENLHPRYVHQLLRDIEASLDDFVRAARKSDATGDDHARINQLLDQISPSRAYHHHTFHDTLTEMSPHLYAASRRYAEQRNRALYSLIERRDFQRWLAAVSSGRAPLYDQPDELIAGIESVRGHADRHGEQRSGMFGPHHWQITDRNYTRERGDRGVIIGASTEPYREALDRDMAGRDRAQMTRILQIMGQSQAGRQVFSSDSTFVDALNAWASAHGEGRTAAEYIEEAQRQLPTD